MKDFDSRNYLVAQAGSPQPVPIKEPIKIDTSEPREVVVVDNKSYSPVEVALRKADEAGGAMFTLLLLGLMGFIALGGHKKIFGVFDALTQLINLLRETQKETAEAVKRNSLTLEKVSENDAKITETLVKQQETIGGLMTATPEIKEKQNDQISRLKYAIKLLEFNATLIIAIAERSGVSVNGKPEKLQDRDD